MSLQRRPILSLADPQIFARLLTDSPDNADTDHSAKSLRRMLTAQRFARIWSLGLGMLLLVTYPLWFQIPDHGSGFPRVSWITLPSDSWIVFAAEMLALGALICGLTAVWWAGNRRWCWWVIGISLACLVVLDQHRLQPWVYQSLLYAMILAGLSWREGRPWMMAIAISVYFYSALGKLDYQFIHTVGNQMIQTLTGPIGGVSELAATRFAIALPIAELSIAVLLAIPKTRRLGGVVAIAMHLTLIGLLGPWALGHSLGVLAWNGLLAVQAGVLFVAAAPDQNDNAAAPMPVRWITRVILVGALLLPLTERFGYWDHWLSWALYSPHNSRAEIQVHRSVIDQMQPIVREYLDDDADGDRWSQLDIGRWSLEQRWVPIYPQARYQLALALQIARRGNLGQAIRVKLKSVSDRRTGRRQETFLIGRSELEREASRFWLVSGRGDGEV